jgi:hypothetical protein
MAKDTLKNSSDATGGGEDQMKPGTITGSATKGYAEHECDGSSYDKYGCRIDLNKLASHTFK